MSYDSIDEVQEFLAKEVFQRTNDAKKASGRALGTFIETITYYLLKSWRFGANMSIETRLPEYGDPELTHNVEFTLHKLRRQRDVAINFSNSYTTKNLIKELNLSNELGFTPAASKKIIDIQESAIKNCAVVGSDSQCNYIAQVDVSNNKCYCSELFTNAYAMFECKRVGKEGDAKGPQTIEKAKQGAYVARTVSELQRVVNSDGTLIGLLKVGNKLVTDDYYNCIERIISGELKGINNFVLTVGIVSNHGNWFTAENQNKELKVLNKSYDWLLFLSDEGLTKFIKAMFELPACSEAFRKSYSLNERTGKKNANCFTKSVISTAADVELTKFFNNNIKEIESWFNILTPRYDSLDKLKEQLNALRSI